MCPNTETFSKITDIDTQRKLLVDLELRRHGDTASLVTVNGFTVDRDKIRFEFDLLDPVVLSIDLLKFTEGVSAIEVFLTINGHEVLPKYQHLSSSNNSYIDKLGNWTFKIPKNFYLWYHTVTGKGFIA